MSLPVDFGFEILSGDHPLSNGHQLRLVTTCELFTDEARLDSCEKDEADLKRFFELNPLQGYYQGSLSFMKFGGDVYHYVLFIHSDVSTKTRLIELIVHEVSHLCDMFFDKNGVEPCTEIRAYYNDWIVGKCLHHVKDLD